LFSPSRQGCWELLGAQRAWPLQIEHLPLTAFLTLLGAFGAVFSWKYHERFDFHMNRAREYRDVLDARLPAVGIRKLKKDADKKTEAEYPRLFHLRLYRFWVGLHLLLGGFGMLLTVWIIISWIHQRHGAGKLYF
jgi:hypothetical protein